MNSPLLKIRIVFMDAKGMPSLSEKISDNSDSSSVRRSGGSMACLQVGAIIDLRLSLHKTEAHARVFA